MGRLTCAVVGGGYAGIHAVKAIREQFQGEELAERELRLILIDQNPYHLRKVLLFKPAAADEDITVPFSRLFAEGVEVIQGEVSKVRARERQLIYKDMAGQDRELVYDILIFAAGSIVRQPEPRQGGTTLNGLDSAKEIREVWCSNLRKAVYDKRADERSRLMTLVVAGAGISGIETSAELAYHVRADAKVLGIEPNEVRVILVNTHNRLFPEGPDKVGRRLEHALTERGVEVIHSCRVQEEKEGLVRLSNGQTLPAGLCVWTLGLLPHPMLESMGLPVTQEGYVAVDESYRVQGLDGIYCIGDCAHIVSPSCGRADGKTCKEAIAQASRLGKVLVADLKGRPAPKHQSHFDFFCFGLGPGQGMVWTRKWGLDIILSGKLGWRVRKWIWDIASFQTP
ncbi:NAD(P)/FAD-dependent oxidoreductase [Paenibacillus puldeungensis]|uniref:NAD(P)/FAD-dependent oxidoreductase n=1 Tax=Paenibacillus puldeungensis TaxID=696536 RepID=A0ABW3RV39_9BACL